MRQQPVTTAATFAVGSFVVLMWTFGLLAGDLAGAPVESVVEIGGPVELVWRGVCLVAGLLLVLAARPAVRRLDPAARAGAAALLVQLGGLGLLLLAVVPKAPQGEVLTDRADPAAGYGTVAALVIGALLPAAGFLLAARWRGHPHLGRATVVSFVTSTLALWAMLASSLDPAPDSTWGGLAQRLAFTASLAWVVWLLARSLEPERTG